MEKQVIFRDRQELQSADLNNIQGFADDALRHVVQDAVSTGRWYTGMAVTATGATDIVVAAGRLYADGEVYAKGQESTVNLFQYLPLVTKKIVAVVAWGAAVETDMQPRDFLLDLTTGETQPEAVAMQRLDQCNVNVVPGVESADPQAPALQSETAPVAWITLTPTGVERIEMNAALLLPRLDDHAARVGTLEVWRTQVQPQITTIATDLSALSNKTEGLADRNSLIELSLDLARVKEQLNLPSGYASYASDGFSDAEQTDVAGSGYTARIENGLHFPFAGEAKAPLAVFNPYDSAIKQHADGLVLPAYTHQPRIATNGYSGDVSISQYQFQTTELKKYVRTVYQYHHGWHWNYYNNWYARYYWNYRYYVGVYPYYWRYYQHYGYYTSHQETTYQLEQVTHSINGAILAQTVLVPNAMWLTRVGLQLTQIGADGDLNLVLCDTEAGKPLPSQTLAHVTVARADLKKYPTETVIDIPPVLLAAGKRYALMLITQGDHRAATVSGNNYTQGTLFYGTDGEYMQGDLTKDLMFTLYGANFSRARTEVALQSVSLAGGITDIDITAPHVVPEGCELTYEFQVGGKWSPLASAELQLTGLPNIVPLRAVLLGTSDLMPALCATADAVTGSRPGLGFIHYGTVRTLAVASASVQVQVVVAQWDEANHGLTCQLVSGGTVIDASTVEWRDEPDGQAKRAVFTFAPDPAISSYQVKLSGTRADGSAPFVVVERTDVAL